MKDPAFLFYPADFLIGCSDLTMVERGQYITLLCLQHQKGHLSKKTVGLCLGFEWVSLSEELRAKFKEDETGLIYNGRLEREIMQRSQYIDKQRSNGKMGGRPKNQIKPTQNPNNNPTETQTKASRDEDINIIEDENIDENSKGGTGENEKTPNVENHCTEGEETFCEVLDELDFDNVWAMYQRKGNKKTSRRKWDKLPKRTKMLAVEHIPHYVKSTPVLKYRKNFEVYITQEAWNDIIISEINNEADGIAITENGGTMGVGNPGNGAYTFRTDAEKRRNEREMLVKVSERILQQPEP